MSFTLKTRSDKGLENVVTAPDGEVVFNMDEAVEYLQAHKLELSQSGAASKTGTQYELLDSKGQHVDLDLPEEMDNTGIKNPGLGQDVFVKMDVTGPENDSYYFALESGSPQPMTLTQAVDSIVDYVGEDITLSETGYEYTDGEYTNKMTIVDKKGKEITIPQALRNEPVEVDKFAGKDVYGVIRESGKAVIDVRKSSLENDDKLIEHTANWGNVDIVKLVTDGQANSDTIDLDTIPARTASLSAIPEWLSAAQEELGTINDLGEALAELSEETEQSL